MVFKRFTYIAFFYILSIIILAVAGTYILFNTYFWLTSVWIFAFLLLLVVFFLKYIKKQHLKLSHFLLSISQDDFSVPYSKEPESIDFDNAFNQLSRVIVSLRDEAQVNYQYLQTIINQINTAIICLDENDMVVLSNSTATELFYRKYLKNIYSLSVLHNNLPLILSSLKAGEKKLIKIKMNDQLFNYSIQVACFKSGKNSYRLFSFSNVQSELEQAEIESWQKLTRVLTHEIMNSAIPISNLTGLVYKQLFNKKGLFVQNISDEQKHDVKESLNTIESRSKGLAKFVDATKNFTKMPKPVFKEIPVSIIVKRVVTLLKPELDKLTISLKQVLEDDICILADKNLVEQVLINLLLNATDALEGIKNPNIEIHVFKDSKEHVVFSVKDNGKGISSSALENIFIPFYTTKEKGSGVGLSLVKQIMLLHKGNVLVKSEQGQGAVFTLVF